MMISALVTSAGRGLVPAIPAQQVPMTTLGTGS